MGEDLIENEIYIAKLFGSDLQGNDLYKLEPLKQIGNATFVKVNPEFKEGDILSSKHGILIFKGVDNWDCMEYYAFSGDSGLYYDGACVHDIEDFKIATEKEKQHLFDVMKKNGKRWNAETMEIEDIPKFKEGDFVYEDGRIMIAKNHPNNYYALIYPKLDMKPIYNRRYAPTMPLSSLSFRYATEDEKQLLIDALKKDGKQWNAEKLTIEDIPQPKFKIGEKVRIKRGVNTGIFMCDELTLTVNEYHNQYRNILYCKGLPYLFHEDWLEPWSEEPKGGDLAIFWDNNYSNPLIRLYHAKSYRVNKHYDNMETPWDNAVKWDGTKEQFEKILHGEI